MWGPILSQILSAVLPLLEKLLHDWLAGRLALVAAETNPPAALFGTDPAGDLHAKLYLLSKVRDSLWFWQTAKRRAVDTAIGAVNR